MILQIDTVWPTSLPLPLIDYTGSPRNSTIMSKDSELIVLRRSRFERTYSALVVSWQLDRTQFDAFKSFVRVDLRNGMNQFKIELRYPNNSLLTEWAVRILDGYTSSYTDGIWAVVATLDLVNPINF